MHTDRRTRLDPDERRAQLVELGVRALAERSLHDLSVEEIATQAGISKSLMFHYFGSRRRFQLAVLQAAATDLLSATEPVRGLSPAAKLRRSIEDSVDYIDARRDLYVSLVRGAASGDAAMREIFDRTRGALADRTLEGICQLGADTDDPLLPIGIRGWLALTEEAIITWTPDGPVTRDRLVDFIESALYRAVLSRD